MTVTGCKSLLFRNESYTAYARCFTSYCICYCGSLNDSGFICSETENMTLKPIHKKDYKVESAFEILTGSRLTSSMGNSSSSGRQGTSTPMRKGVGEQLMSNMLAGNTGTNVCCHVNGYSSASTAWPHRDNTLQSRGEERKAVSHTDHMTQGYQS